MKKICFFVLAVMALAGMAQSASAQAVRLRASLIGADEVPATSSTATAEFSATISRDGSITFTLTFEGLAANAAASHIHFGQQNVNGGVTIFLCSGGGQPACPAAQSGTVEGTITAANVVGPAAQGIPAGYLDKALQAIVQGEGYVNIHTANFPAGEIRGQVKVMGRLSN